MKVYSQWLKSSGWQYAAAFLTFVGVSLINLWLESLFGYQAIALIYLLSIVVLALFVDRGAIVFATVLTAAWWNFYFAPPRFEFNIVDEYDRMMLITYFVVTLIVGHLTTHLRTQRIAKKEREERTSALYQLTRDLADAADMDDIFCKLIYQVRIFFKADVALLLPNLHTPDIFSPYTASTWSPKEKERQIVTWVLAEKKPAGRGMQISSEAEGLYWPLNATGSPSSVLALRLKSKACLTSQQRNLLEDFVRQIALILDRQRLRDAEFKNTLLAESERLGRTLLNSVSHELRTPIAAITSAASELHSSPELSPAQQNLTAEIEAASARLNRVVQGLLNAARLQSGQLRPKMDWCDASDLIQVALRKETGLTANRQITTKIASGLPLIKVDFVLMEQVLSNLIANAVAHTPAGTPIEIAAHSDGNHLILQVADRGAGIPPDQLDRIFDLFHRAPDARTGGTGLGLAIVKGFIEAQGGHVQAANRPDGGAIFTLHLPVTDSPKLPEDLS